MAKKLTDVFDKLDNIIGDWMEGKTSDKDAADMACAVNKYLIEHPHPHDMIVNDESVYTKSEVKAMIAAILRETEQVPSIGGGFIDIIFPTNVRGAIKEHGIIIDPS